MSTCKYFVNNGYRLELFVLGVKTAALAALGEIGALPRNDGGGSVPLPAGCRGVKDGESTLNAFLKLWVRQE